jgi:gluconokinase
MIVVLMGVTGSGKTTVGRVLARELGWAFYDADDSHPPSNIEKMRRGIPLSDSDRKPWLEALAHLIDNAQSRGEDVVLACSALKHAYQEYLRHDLDGVHYVVLYGSPEIIRQRLQARKGHFMDPSLLPSQLEILEPPDDAIQVDVAASPEQIAQEIMRRLGLRRMPMALEGRTEVWTVVALPETFAVAKLRADVTVPDWATSGGTLNSATRSPEEWTIVCREGDVPESVTAERGWRCLRVQERLDFSLAGVLASLLGPLAAARVPVFVVSTFGTDYVLIKAQDFEQAISTLRRAGHRLA